MKPFYLFVIVFLLVGICSVSAYDLIVLRDGNMIEAKIMEISPSEIRYKRFDHLEGPMIVLSIDNVLSVRYENGTTEVFNAAAAAGQEKKKQEKTAINSDKLTIGINANPAGLLTNGASLCVELNKGNFTSDINIVVPYGLTNKSKGGLGALFTFNYIWHSRIGGFYLGGGIGYSWSVDTLYVPPPTGWDFDDPDDDGYYSSHINTIGLNIGYRFVMNSGLSFRVGAYAGASIDWAVLSLNHYHDRIDDAPISFYIKPDLAIGYSF